MIYRGYILCEGKKALQKFNGVENLSSLEAVNKSASFAGVLNNDTIMIDIDDMAEATAFKKLLEGMGTSCPILKTSRGMHFYFKGSRQRCKTKTLLLCGVEADIKNGPNAYDAIKVDGNTREWLNGDYNSALEPLPVWCQVGGDIHFYGMGDGSGRNDAFYKHIITCQKKGMKKEEIIKLFEAINNTLLKEPLRGNELNTVLRDEAFETDIQESGPTGGKKSFKETALELIEQYHIKKKDKVLYVDGVTINNIGDKLLEWLDDSTIKSRAEITAFIEGLAPTVQEPSKNCIRFLNGVYDLEAEAFYSDDGGDDYPNIIMTNYKSEAYSKVVDITLNKICCYSKERRELLEELIGYSFLRDCRFRKAFILYGDKRNGKSTFLRALKAMLGEVNVSTLSLHDISRQFATVGLLGKLANIGDDISGDYVPDTSTLKKVISGEYMTVDRKHKEALQIRPYSTLIFSSNDLAPFKDDSGAMLDRLVIVPFEAKFNTTDSDYNPNIEEDMVTTEALEYLAKIGLEGLKRLVSNNSFTVVDVEILDEFKAVNNPINVFFEDIKEEFVEKGYLEIKEVYWKYREYIVACGLQGPYAIYRFSILFREYFKCERGVKNIGGKSRKCFVYNDQLKGL